MYFVHEGETGAFSLDIEQKLQEMNSSPWNWGVKDNKMKIGEKNPLNMTEIKIYLMYMKFKLWDKCLQEVRKLNS